jgi:hypothetical protein
MTATKILNIDELLQDSPMKVIVDGKEHLMKNPSMKDFLENMKDIEKLSAAPSIVHETEITVRVIARSFPSLKESDVLEWPVSAIESLFGLIRGIDPDAVIEGSDKEGNPSPAS